MRWLYFAALLSVFVSPHQARSQTEAQSFDVASVKPNKSGDAASSLGFDKGGRFRVTNETLWRLIAEAYADAPEAYPLSRMLPRYRIVGGPGWLNDERFDIDARPSSSVGSVESHMMLRALLAERFGLVVHTETRRASVYHLVQAQASGALGPGLTRSDVDCAALRKSGGLSSLPVAPDKPRPCVMVFGPGVSRAIGLRLSELAENVLASFSGRTVIDRTGLQGPFDWTLSWNADLVAPSGGDNSAIDLDKPTLGVAIREQLGLKLESADGPVSVLVVDRAERPTPN